MSATPDDQVAESEQDRTDESPQNLPPMAWVTLIGFAAFFVLFFTCANTFMFN
ncbi:hypothetical protein ACT3SY_13015 [Brachybacterium sp. AOP42-E1-35]|uniref:hypothetical protein n=1 Tax=Brachybacterium sp. AOP42-E1-35 TaxID=3457664 RepID=UPI00402AC674